MPRKPRDISGSGVYHFINRGVNKRNIFHKAQDFEQYLSLIKEYKEAFSIDIYHYCLMSNHTHLLLRSDDIESLSKFAHFVQRRYAYYYCKIYHWSEQVFRKRFISIPIENDSYLLECGRYIERNPMEAKLVDDSSKYLYSSYRYYVNSTPNVIITPSPAYEGLSAQIEQRTLLYKFYIEQERTSYKVPMESKIKELTCPF